MFEGEYTTIGQKWHLHPNVVKKSLNSNLGRILRPEILEDLFRKTLTRSSQRHVPSLR